MYVPTPPVPVPKAVITVALVTPIPNKAWLMPIVPDVISVTVKVVPEIEPVNKALEGVEMRHV